MTVFSVVGENRVNRRKFLRSGGLGAVAAGLVPAIASASAARRLTMVTSWPAGFPGLGTSANRVARRIEAASGGEFSVSVYSAGEKVGPFEVFDAVAAGDFDLYHSADYYQTAKSPAYNFFTAVPFGMTAIEMAGWLLHGGGQELWDELSAPMNIKPLMCTNTGTQMGGWFNREIRTVEDFEGLKIRMPGLGGVALSKLGAEPVNIAGGEIRGALKNGGLDAAEWVGPWNDLAAGLHEVAEHYYYPGFHEPGGSLALGVNLDVWQSFEDTQRDLLKEVTTAEYTRSLTEFNVRNAAALRVLESEHKVRPEIFSQEVLSVIAMHADEVVAEMANEDALTRKVHASFVAARREAMLWSGIGEEAFTSARRNHYAS
jgi:TRAP-type mannitol/chloroaromatic compound transport system substrate-binding protein